MKLQTVYFLKGLPASGKSSWSKNYIETSRHDGRIIKRVNKDDLRLMIDNSIHSKEREDFILTIRDIIIKRALVKGYDVIVDDTNFHPKHEIRIKEIIEEVIKEKEKIRIEFVEKFFSTPLRECIERDRQREKSVGKQVILDMYNRYLRNTEQDTISYNPDLPECIVVDLDGTLALHENRSPFEYFKLLDDRPNQPIVDLVSVLQSSKPNMKTFVFSGRENVISNGNTSIEDLSKLWLKKQNVKFDFIFLRKKGDHRQDSEVKEEMFLTHLKGKYNILYWIDDRQQVISKMREYGLTVLDVAGNFF